MYLFKYNFLSYKYNLTRCITRRIYIIYIEFIFIPFSYFTFSFTLLLIVKL